MYKNIIYTLTVIFVFGLYFAIPIVSAHETKTSGSLKILLHIVPNDDPFIKEESHVVLEFTDSKNIFNVDQCDCRVSISQGINTEKKVLFTSDIFTSQFSRTKTTVSFPYVFQEKGIYTLTFQGTPKITNHYEPINVSYDIRVDNEREHAHMDHTTLGMMWHDHAVHLILFAAAIIVGTYFSIKNK
jgi:hypothetical protein